ncbi:c-type cytochrome biogenesis protein CcmI [Aestuariibacter halophilus]|uniref:C-type cytochrome biogenesis protein CcmI n=1 Tax=Fluctibacter halophilus TaxID=226011 RepID=A0ABS8G2I9_9ALTE|nr:c-type cytochrome biogenesis protein CcmI [Aestuariibacter halophilus]MCC2614797.1 c-type cytochrome biogenesis protein CcmI [Aestuariibacter halophilus]
MTEFYLIAGVLVLLAVVLMTLPWSRFSHRQDHLTNTQIVRQRLQELEREYREGLLSDADKNAAITELKVALADEGDRKVHWHLGSGRWVWLGTVVALLVGAGIYARVNQVSQVQHWHEALASLPGLAQRIVIDGDRTVSPQEMQTFALGLRTELARKGGDAAGWRLLGRLHAALGQMDSAVQAFEKSLALVPDHPGSLTSYAQALMMLGQDEALEKADVALATLGRVQPENSTALGMRALLAEQQGDTQLAIARWQELQSLLPVDSPMQAEVVKRLDALSGNVTAVTVTVSVAQDLLANLPEQGYVFVFAQDAASDSRVPAAVIKQPLSTFPLTVTLTDQNAMMPGVTLSGLQQVRLVARISVDGNVAAQAGELEGEASFELNVGQTQRQDIVISKEIM